MIWSSHGSVIYKPAGILTERPAVENLMINATCTVHIVHRGHFKLV